MRSAGRIRHGRAYPRDSQTGAGAPHRSGHGPGPGPARRQSGTIAMRLAIVAWVAGVGAAVAAPLPAQEQAPRRIAASSFASTEVHLNARPIGNRWYEEDASLSG